MNLLLLFALLLKASFTSFSGLGSLPILRADLVVHHRVLTDAQLNTAVTAGRSGPGPIGIYLVCVGYEVAGIPGAIEGFIACLAPAFLVIALLRWLARVADRPAVQRTIRAVVIASAGMLAAVTMQLADSGIRDFFALAVALAALAALVLTKVESAWVMLAAAVAGIAHHLVTGA